MAKQVFRNAGIVVDDTDLSDHANQVTIEDTADEVEFTGFTANAYKEYGQGLKDATITVTFFQDFDDGSVDSVLRPLYADGGTFDIKVSPNGTVVSGTNPQATMTARLYSYGAIGGAVGDALTVECSFRNAGTAGVTWATA